MCNISMEVGARALPAVSQPISCALPAVSQPISCALPAVGQLCFACPATSLCLLEDCWEARLHGSASALACRLPALTQLCCIVSGVCCRRPAVGFAAQLVPTSLHPAPLSAPRSSLLAPCSSPPHSSLLAPRSLLLTPHSALLQVNHLSEGVKLGLRDDREKRSEALGRWAGDLDAGKLDAGKVDAGKLAGRGVGRITFFQRPARFLSVEERSQFASLPSCTWRFACAPRRSQECDVPRRLAHLQPAALPHHPGGCWQRLGASTVTAVGGSGLVGLPPRHSGRLLGCFGVLATAWAGAGWAACHAARAGIVPRRLTAMPPLLPSTPPPASNPIPCLHR